MKNSPLFFVTCELRVPRLRVACPRCGPRIEDLAWLDRHGRVTQRLARGVARLCAVMSIRHVARYFGLDWKTVKRIDQAHLERTLGPIDLSGVRVIGTACQT